MHQLYNNTAEDTEYSFQGFRFRPHAGRNVRLFDM